MARIEERRSPLTSPLHRLSHQSSRTPTSSLQQRGSGSTNPTETGTSARDIANENDKTDHSQPTLCETKDEDVRLTREDVDQKYVNIAEWKLAREGEGRDTARGRILLDPRPLLKSSNKESQIQPISRGRALVCKSSGSPPMFLTCPHANDLRRCEDERLVLTLSLVFGSKQRGLVN